MSYDPLIYGKSNLERVVGIEPQDSDAEIFLQEKDGSVTSTVIPNLYWILSANKCTNRFKRLKGDLHYKWGIQFNTREEFQKARSYLKRDDIYSVYDPKEALMIKDGLTYFKSMNPKEVGVLSFDIESVGLEKNEDSKVLLISNTFRIGDKVERKLFSYDEYESQLVMIDDWCAWVREKNPSVITGHNIFGFDLPYLDFISKRDGGIEESGLILGRDYSELKFEQYESKFRKESGQFIHYHQAKIYGREIVDTMFLSIKHDVASRKYTSYGLKNIIKQEGLEREDRVHYDSSQIRFNYTIPEEWKKIKEYCIHDADDALALYDLMIAPFFYMTQSIPKSFQSMICSASGSQLNSLMVRSYLQNGHSIPKADEKEHFEGAISLGNPGIYRNVHKVDVSSLYPSIILQFDVYDQDKDPEANFLKMVKTFTERRLEYKRLLKETKDPKYDALQGAFKILINSAYGFCGAPGLNFNSPSCADFITASGREILSKAIEWSDTNKFTLVNCDTDSISYCKKDMSLFTKDECGELLRSLNSLYPEKIKFEDDGLYSCVIVVKAKNYILKSMDGKIKIKGSGLVATQKEAALKEYIKEIINLMLEGKENYIEIYNKYVKEAMDVKDIKRWASRKTVTEKVLNGTRTNETKVLDAIEDEEIQEGDKVYLYFKKDGSLGLVEKFDGDYDPYKLISKIWATTKTFETVLDIKQFPKYHLKRQRDLISTIQ